MNSPLSDGNDSTVTESLNFPTLADARAALGYSLEDMAIATGLTEQEVRAAERTDTAAPEAHIERIRAVLK